MVEYLNGWLAKLLHSDIIVSNDIGINTEPEGIVTSPLTLGKLTMPDALAEGIVSLPRVKGEVTMPDGEVLITILSWHLNIFISDIFISAYSTITFFSSIFTSVRRLAFSQTCSRALLESANFNRSRKFGVKVARGISQICLCWI